MSNVLFMLCYTAVPYSGVRLWWQQYYGLLLKKMYDTVRFWQTLCATYLIPITACLLGLLLFRFLFDFAVPNPQRALRVDNSGSELDHQILFWSELDNINTFDFGVSAYNYYYYNLSLICTVEQKKEATRVYNIVARV